MWLGVRQVMTVAACAYAALCACSGGYPLPPTACDEYCNATLGYYCPDWYDPAGCVSDCEQNHQAPPECRAELDTVIACYTQNPGTIQARCSFDPSRFVPCAAEMLQLQQCANPPQDGSVPGFPSR